MNRKTIGSEIFSSGEKYYFLDFRKAVNGTFYLRITRRDQSEKGFSKRASLIIFEEDISLFIQALSSLLHHAAHADLDEPDC